MDATDIRAGKMWDSKSVDPSYLCIVIEHRRQELARKELGLARGHTVKYLI